MQISGIANQYLQTINATDTSKAKPSLDVGNLPSGIQSSSDSISISPEATKEFKKLAMYTEQASEFLPKVNVLNNADAHNVGYSAWAEDFQSQHKSELEEYNGKFKEYYAATKIEHGIQNADDHYEKVLSLKEGNTEFQQDFENKLSTDPRMIELMDILGIKKPT